jgi:hypothetical protein
MEWLRGSVWFWWTMRHSPRTGADQRELWEPAVRHSVHLLLAWQIAEDKTGRWQAQYRAAARAAHGGERSRGAQRRELTRLLAAFADRGVPHSS